MIKINIQYIYRLRMIKVYTTFLEKNEKKYKFLE